MCSEQFQLCVKTIIIIKSHAPLPRPVTSMEQMGRGLASARVFPPSVQLAWCLQKGLFCFSLWLLSTSLVASGTDCSWKIVSRVGSARKEKVVLSAACLLLLVHTPGWEQAGKGNWVFGSPSESADLCQVWDLPLDSAWLVSPSPTFSESQNGLGWKGPQGSPVLVRQGQWLKNPMALPGVLCSPVVADVAGGHTEVAVGVGSATLNWLMTLNSKNTGADSLSLLWEAVPQHIRPSSFLCTLGLRPDVTKSLLVDGPSVLCHLSQKSRKVPAQLWCHFEPQMMC